MIEAIGDRIWPELYAQVLQGVEEAPRGRKTLALNNVQYRMNMHQHFDATPARKLNPTYIFREFLWFCNADPYDTRMTEYAPIWKSCVTKSGIIHSNYGQYLFNHNQRDFNAPFWNALNQLVNDVDSRRCWVPIFQTYHQDGLQDEWAHNDYPCTTGFGFVIHKNYLHMNVHMRSQDLVNGAGNDEVICYLFQLLAQAYLRHMGVHTYVGDIVHTVDNLHLYERHWDNAKRSSLTRSSEMRHEINVWTERFYTGFSWTDLELLFNYGELKPSALLRMILDIPGAYGKEDQYMWWGD